MKKLLTLSMMLIIATCAFAQNFPEAFSYQAVIRKADGSIIADKNVGIQVGIATDSINGKVVFSEKHFVKTNKFGVVEIEVGRGKADNGVFTDLIWGAKRHFIKIGFSEDGSPNFNFMGASELLSTPYAQYAKHSGDALTAGNGLKIENGTISNIGDADSDPTNEIQKVSVNGNILTLSKGGGEITLPSNGAQGPQGEKGEQGAKGDKGDIGLTGAQGIQGIKGEKGEQGTKGDKGDIGLTGAQGIQGVKGDKGDKGEQGLQGQVGPLGLTGPAGPKGDQGIQGVAGPVGPQGPAGGPVGPQGIQGVAGPTGPQGPAGPAGAQGLKGDTGATGLQGPQGLTGATGPVGAQGIQGVAGPTGPQGPAGSYTAGIGINITGNVISNTGDLSNTNEIQTLGLTGSTLSLSNGGGSVNLPSASGYWSLSGSNIYKNNSGNVGIGTTAPSNFLTIESSQSSFGNAQRDFVTLYNTASGSGTFVGLKLQTSGSGITGLQNCDPTYGITDYNNFGQLLNTGAGLIYRVTAGIHKWQTGNSSVGTGYNRMVLDANGNLGIGIDTPTAKLQISSGDVYIDDATKGVIMKSPNGSCWRMTVSNTGLPVFTAITCP